MRRPLIPFEFRRRLAWWLWRQIAPEGHWPVEGEIRPNPGAEVTCEGCRDVDEVVGDGFLHVEQMDKNVYWAALYLPTGDRIAMWFSSKSKITLTAERD